MPEENHSMILAIGCKILMRHSHYKHKRILKIHKSWDSGALKVHVTRARIPQCNLVSFISKRGTVSTRNAVSNRDAVSSRGEVSSRGAVSKRGAERNKGTVSNRDAVSSRRAVNRVGNETFWPRVLPKNLSLQKEKAASSRNVVIMQWPLGQKLLRRDYF